MINRHDFAGVNLVDFRRAAESARIAINRWVEDNTRQKIRELVSSGTLDASSRLAVVIAADLKGMRALQFSRTSTRDEPFHLAKAPGRCRRR